MSTGKKILIGSGIAILALVITGIAVHESHKGVVTVQSGKAQKMDLVAVVSASGEIKPKTYVNIGANAFGKIIKLYVKEGDRVKQGTDAGAARERAIGGRHGRDASVAGSGADGRARGGGGSEYLDGRPQPGEVRCGALGSRLDSRQGLYKDALIAKSDYDMQKAAHQTAVAGLAQAQARVAQAKAQKDSADRRIAQANANLTHAADVLKKTTYCAPFDGVVTNLAGARGRDGGDGNSEFAGQHADDAGGYVGDHRRGEGG